MDTEISGLDTIVSNLFCPKCGRPCGSTDFDANGIVCKGRRVEISGRVTCVCGHTFEARATYRMEGIIPV